MICVYATCHVKPECTEAFLTVTETLIAETRKEEGNLSYHLGREIGETNVFTFIEHWRDEAALDLHITLPHFTQAVTQLSDLLTAPLDVHKLESL